MTSPHSKQRTLPVSFPLSVRMRSTSRLWRQVGEGDGGVGVGSSCGVCIATSIVGIQPIVPRLNMPQIIAEQCRCFHGERIETLLVADIHKRGYAAGLRPQYMDDHLPMELTSCIRAALSIKQTGN